ncbi:hypothetical protein TUM4433_17550 [Shewanella schlegeliana]|nr:hypothetical protein TUM4433_17550 [Shewanella schlegeliana]
MMEWLFPYEAIQRRSRPQKALLKGEFSRITSLNLVQLCSSLVVINMALYVSDMHKIFPPYMEVILWIPLMYDYMDIGGRVTLETLPRSN